MIPFVPDWRWFRSGSSSPWYPTMKLFRQDVIDDWTNPIVAIQGELLQYASAHQTTVITKTLTMVSDNTDDALRQATAHLQAGRINEVERICREILFVNPRSIPAWHLLGSIALDMGRPDAGAHLIEQALQSGLSDANLLSLLGRCYLRMGRAQDAHRMFGRTLEIDPTNDEAIYGQGTLLAAANKFEEAIPLLARAEAKFPHVAELQFNYAYSLSKVGKLSEAARHWQMALHLQPDHAPSLYRLGTTLVQLKSPNGALGPLSRLVEIQPRYADGYMAYAEALAMCGKLDQAIAAARKATEVEPNRAELYDMLGIFYARAGRMEESIQASMRAVQLQPDFFTAIVNVGVTFRKLERFDEAIQWFERAAQLKPDDLAVSQALYKCLEMTQRMEKALEVSERALRYHPQHPHVHFDHSRALLTLGNYIEGFEEYEWRWRCKAFDEGVRTLEGQKWDGISDLAGKTILLHCEQGYGDMIQFARYIPIMRRKCKQVIIGVPWDIRPLLESSFDDCHSINRGETNISSAPSDSTQAPDSAVVDWLDQAAFPPYDFHFPLMSMARVHKSTIETLPPTPYLHADPARINKWKPKIDSHASGLKVGLVWGGSASPEPRRSCSIKALWPLSDLTGISWYSLQTDEHREQLRDAPARMNILDIGRDFMDFGDSAAVMAQLDLVITVDTSSAHLAGALGVKTFAMINYAPDWRWGIEGDSTPWYPSMKIFRQPKLYDWSSVVSQIHEELASIPIQVRCRQTAPTGLKGT